MQHLVHDYALAAPEMVLAAAAMALLMFGVFRGDGATRLVAWGAVAALAVALVLVLQAPAGRSVTFAGMFVVDGFARFAKVLVLLAAALGIVMSLGFIRREGMERFEYPILLLLATLGMLMMISANDLIALYVGLELQSLALYVVAAFQRDSLRATEAGLKYFVLGALASGMLLYGCSLIYGFTGTTGFEGIAQALKGRPEPALGLLLGVVFLTAGLAFKISAVPFHMWTPDVYEGAPTPVTAFFAVAPKVAALALFCRTMLAPFGQIAQDWQQIVVFLAIASMLLGAFAAIGQNNIKRLMAYSSIGHVGYALIGLASGGAQGIQSILIYLAIYVAMNAGTFACILCMRVKGDMREGVNDLAGLGRNQPLLALALAIFMFSMAGIPPLAGFFGKFYVFVAAIEAKLYVLAVIGVLSSAVGAYYYLRIVKLMYFDEPAEAFERPIGREMAAILVATALFVVAFALFAAPILEGAGAAAQTLVPSGKG